MRRHIRAMNPRLFPLLVRTWLTIAVIDGIFASCLNAFAYGSTAARVWLGVASTILGPSALQGGTGVVLIGLLMHASVAFTWSTVFLTLATKLPALRRAISTPGGILGVASLYGPAIWCVMSLR